MPCKQCQENRRRSLEKRRLIDQKRRERLAERCVAGDQRSCAELEAIRAAQEYRAANRYRSEHHRRAASQKRHVVGNLGDFSLESNEHDS